MSRSVGTCERPLRNTQWPIASILLIVAGCFNPDRGELTGDATDSSSTDARATDEAGGSSPSSSAATDSSSPSTSGETTWTSSPDDSGDEETGDDKTCNPLDPACPEGEKCQPFADGTAACTSAPNPGGAAGDRCAIDRNTEIDNCQPGLFCWGAPQSSSGTCVALCDEDGPYCAEPWLGCGLPWYDAKIGLCLPLCDPLTQDCVEGTGCYGGGGGTFLCYPSAQQGGAYASACTQVNECSPGLQCAQPAAVPGCVAPVGCCTPYCDLTSPDGDQQCQGYAAGQACVPYFTRGQAPPGYESVGICVIP
jgi:hypothetical protein